MPSSSLTSAARIAGGQENLLTQKKGAVLIVFSGWLSVVETTAYSVIGYFDIAASSPDYI